MKKLTKILLLLVAVTLSVADAKAEAARQDNETVVADTTINGTPAEPDSKPRMPPTMNQEFLFCTEGRYIRQAIAAKHGLPSVIAWSWAELNQVADEEDRKSWAIERGIPSRSSWRKILTFNNEKVRQKMARARGLPLTTSWVTIMYYDRELIRIDRATERCIPMETSFEDIKLFEENMQ